ncbi:hypothetical protein PF005_g6679 [Phytophthora fragariae]|uniref:Uncharacterized protein n=1 Tax=Phytophthora fragariae TaxID=53985 RepID=A0A6A3YS59_9STRA|nr:hypothetical protein PF009_g3378 [Phytophthora fragariae]KAE9124447.1 hypothetical protein PF010_g5995 [Phytophthora fragariae]KAE9127997.1 hypothetical protein PF007_g5423 [Phytophthora fragariae]KAE9222485.1 hypothetical protein PF005_g6679 [Phytophthora fragariae]KAE9247149.1 hypothetical protein PF004_g4460 [Phytophthora fragariae]
MLAESDQELLVQLTSVWQASFKLELFIYVSRVATSATIRRATEGRIAAAASLIDEYLSALPAEQQLGEASRAYWAVTHARQPEQTPLAIPTNHTFTQLRRIDDYQREADEESQQRAASPEFGTVRRRLNGGMIPLDLNVTDLREALGLQSASAVRAPVPSSTPAVNMKDTVHLSDASME